MNLQTTQLKLSLVISIILFTTLIIYIRKVIMYRNDERGQTILAKASTWVIGGVTIVFAISLIAQYFFEIADYAKWFNIFMGLFLACTYLTQVLGIFYYERKI